MVVDTSALVAILAEDDGADYLAELRSGLPAAISAVNAYEARLVLSGRVAGKRRYPPEYLERLEHLLEGVPIEIVPFGPDQALLAHRAYLRYGRGFHPARLNFADCTAYVLAKLRDEPLLFKGEDFARTDVTPAV